MTPGTTLAPRLTVEQVVAVYEQAEREIRAGFALIERAEGCLNDTFTMEHSCPIHLRTRRDHHQFHFGDPDAYLSEVRRQIWSTLLDRLELRRFMSISAWDKLDREVREGEVVPDITQASVMAMAKQFRDRMPEMLEESVREVYDWLRPRGGTRLADYKTNSVLEVGRKVVLGGMVESEWSTWRVRYDRDQRLTALENVFSALDGKGSVTKNHYSAISTAIKPVSLSEPCVGETEYFKFRGFKNNNLHLEFRRLDLLARFNQIAGGARLRPAPAAAE